MINLSITTKNSKNQNQPEAKMILAIISTSLGKEKEKKTPRLNYTYEMKPTDIKMTPKLTYWPTSCKKIHDQTKQKLDTAKVSFKI
jgi:hypothetical protein